MGILAQGIETAFANRERREIEIPDWNMTIYVYPLTTGQLAEISAAENDFRRIVTILQVRAKREDGGPAFDAQDVEKLYTHGTGVYGPDFVAKLAGDIMSDVNDVDPVEAGKD